MVCSPRREFLLRSARWFAGASGVLGVLSSDCLHTFAADRKETAVPASSPLPIVDTHQHLWDLSRFDLPWTKGEEVASLNRSYLMSDYLRATEGLNIVKAVYMEVDVHPSQQAQEAKYVLDIIRQGNTPTVAAVISGRPNSEEFRAYIEPFAKEPEIKGVRQVLHVGSTPAGYCLQPQFVKGIQLLGELGLSFDLCMRAGEIVDAVKLVDQCPKTRFIVDHCGNLSVQSKDPALRERWKKGMSELAQRENVVCKISGIVASAKPGAWTADDLAPNIHFSLETFGKERVMFGGDWPVCTLAASYRQWLDALKKIVSDWSEADRRKLFHDNAVRFYGLS